MRWRNIGGRMSGTLLAAALAVAGSLSAASGAQLTLAVLATTDRNGLEGLDVAPDGSLYVTNTATRALYRVSLRGQVALFATLPIVPQVVLMTREGFVVTGQVKEPDFSAPPAQRARGMSAAAMGMLEARVLLLDRAGHVVRTVAGPAGAFFNGLARFGEDYLIADSSAATIWRLDPRRARVQPWLQDPALAGLNGRFPGANGIKVVDGVVYVSNTSAGTLYRIDTQGGRPRGHLQLIAHIRAPDDFAVARDGTIYAPSDGEVLSISAAGETRVLADGCRGCDAALLAHHGSVVYLVTHGFGPAAGRGTIYQLDLRHGS